MKYQLIKPINAAYTTLQQVLTNRGMTLPQISKYFNTTDDDIIPPSNLDNLREGVECFLKHVDTTDKTLIVVDSDADGYTSSALLINWMYEKWPTYVLQNVSWVIHEGKQHGISDIMDICREQDFIIIPDAGSNDYAEHKALKDAGIDVLVLDHHEADHESKDAIVINNQLSRCYENKSLSGVGVVYKFCLAIDELNLENRVDKYLDLVALGLISDMMDLRSIETHHLIQEGLKNIRNPYFYSMCQKNAFSIGSTVTPHGVAWFVTPFINAFTRSGSQKEKELVFKAMLNHYAFKKIPSTKRGHKAGDEETIVEQAVRESINVKRRQTTTQDAMLSKLEKSIVDNNMMDNKVLLFLMPIGSINKNLAGLIANQIASKYQRPTAILIRQDDGSYEGSARGCDNIGIDNFKDICQETGFVKYAEGHQSAFGLGIESNNVDNFIEATNDALKNMSNEPIYFVDYIFSPNDNMASTILNIEELKSIWGQNLPEPKIVVKNLRVTSDNVALLSPGLHPTIKFNLANNISAIKFGASQEEYDELISGNKIVDILGYCTVNEWQGMRNPQIKIIQYDFKTITDWGF